MKEFVIDRKKWLRGEGLAASYLHRTRDSKMCCLGFYLESCGVPRSALTGMGGPLRVSPYPQQADWLVNSTRAAESPDCDKLIDLNDEPGSDEMDEATRERGIAEIFESHEIKVTFV